MHLARPELDVGIASLDVPRAVDFYRDLMGLESLPTRSMGSLGSMSRLRIGDHTLKLYAFTKRPEACPGGTGVANGIRLLAFLLDDLDAVLARFDGAGHAYRRLPMPADAAFQVAFAADADGNALELVGLGKPAGGALRTRLQIGLTVSDVAASRRFYGERLGLKEEPEMKLPASMGVVGGTRYGFQLGRTTLKFWSMGEDRPRWTGAPARRTGIRLITAWVDDVDAVHEDLLERGMTVEVEPHDFEGQARVMFVADPDGNWIEFASAL